LTESVPGRLVTIVPLFGSGAAGMFLRHNPNL
jgi:hypothetical protein